MNRSSRKLQQRTDEKTEQAHEATSKQGHTARELTTVEQVLRHDSTHTVVPPAIATRLQDSISREPRQPKGWWGRLFSR